jgi:Chaperone of endosialidase
VAQQVETLSANIVNATTQYNIDAVHALSFGNSSVFIGPFAPLNKNISGNTFVGSGAGLSNSAGGENSFFGSAAGQENTGDRNAFFGSLTGQFNTTGGFNSFFGMGAGRHGLFSSSTGGANSFFGYFAGKGNLSGSNNTAIGREATFGSDNLMFATAIGAFAQVDQSNSLVLGSIAGVNTATASVNVGIGTTMPQATLDVHGTALVTPGSGKQLSLGTPNGEIGLGMIGAGNRADMRFDGSTLKLVAIAGGGIPPSTSGLAINLTGSVGIATTTPVRLLDVNGRARVRAIPLEASTAAVCFNAAGDLLQCGASSLRWKANVRPFLGGLDIIRRLRPIDFNWKESGLADIGLSAEDVAKVAPSLTLVNSKGEPEGVKYERLNIVLINAIKQQQSQIEALQVANAALNARLQALERGAREQQPLNDYVRRSD